LTYSFSKAGRHTLKVGGEYFHQSVYHISRTSIGVRTPRADDSANIESLFPNQFDSSTWNLAPLSSISGSGARASGGSTSIARNIIGAWAQEDWTLTPRLTLNLGVRYDAEPEALPMTSVLGPFYPANRPDDWNNVGPRLGFASTGQHEPWSVAGGANISATSRTRIPRRDFNSPSFPDVTTAARTLPPIHNGAQPTFDRGQGRALRCETRHGLCPEGDITTSLAIQRPDPLELSGVDRRGAAARNGGGRRRGLRLSRDAG
jgi:hypothetical protein